MPLVLISPIGLEAGFWELGGLAGRADAVVHLLPGFGGRTRAVPPLEMDQLADELVDAIPGRLDLVGVSMGAMVAQHVCLRHPDRVGSAVLACTGASVDPAAMRARADAALAGGIEGVLDETLRRWFSPGALAAPRHPGVDYAERTLLALDRRAFADGWRSISSHDARPGLPGVRAPLTVIAGADDLSAPPERCAEVSRLAPISRLIVVPGPHMLALERAVEFAALVDAHLDWARAGAAPDRRQ